MEQIFTSSFGSPVHNSPNGPSGLSILIPTFNYVPRPLLSALVPQAVALSLPFQIIVGNDGSSLEVSQQLQDLAEEFGGLVHISSASNQGRAGVRNRLASEAIYSHLLFIDADSEPAYQDFLPNYTAYIAQDLGKNSVLVGGTAYKPARPAPKQLLRWLYGCNSEALSAAKRNLSPFKSLTINNICLPKALFQKIGLHHTAQSYGHEDTLFGYHLQEQGHSVTHIDNQVYHLGLETSDVFLAKSAEAAQTLSQLVHANLLPASFTKLSASASFLHRFRIGSLFLRFFSWRRNAILASLLGPRPNLSYLSFYKLAAYLQASKQA